MVMVKCFLTLVQFMSRRALKLDCAMFGTHSASAVRQHMAGNA
jgi:hypothetical protein